MKYILFLIACGLLSFSIIDKITYYPKLQWYTSSSPLFPVKGKPKQVTEYFYSGVDGFKPGKDKFNSYDEFLYDTAGNISTRKLFVSDNLWNVYNFKYTSTDINVVCQNKIKGATTKTLFMKLEPTSTEMYREVVFAENGINDTTLYRYNNNGDEIIKSQTVSINGIKNSRVTRLFYDGQRLLRRVIEVKGEYRNTTADEIYFYGKDNTVDSIITTRDPYRNRWLFTKNGQGDPVTEISIDKGDTAINKSYRYLYDNKNNWISRVEEDHLSETAAGKKYTLIIRKIKY